MKQYLINELDQGGFHAIITLLDYQTQISRCLKSIKITSTQSEKLLVDTLLCSGMNEYRFIETTLNEDGTINLDQYKYVSVDSETLAKANDILKHQPLSLMNSVLPESQAKKILQS
ncbi:MAG: type II toxin-antitoxin system RnlB family antitoxin [Bacillota bacterium]|nr:type II toxin-antitoxin system RnlB family antitoxin [Bacillota bacterium]